MATEWNDVRGWWWRLGPRDVGVPAGVWHRCSDRVLCASVLKLGLRCRGPWVPACWAAGVLCVRSEVGSAPEVEWMTAAWPREGQFRAGGTRVYGEEANGASGCVLPGCRGVCVSEPFGGCRGRGFRAPPAGIFLGVGPWVWLG